MNLAHLIIRQWRQRPARSVLSIASVAIAAAAVLGVSMAQTSVRLGYRKLLEATEGRPALEIVALEGGRFTAPATLEISAAPGVAAVTPIATRATLARVNGKRFRAVMLGLPPDAARLWDTLPLTDGEPCREPDQAIVSANLAKSLRINVGDRLIVLASHGSRSATISGLVDSRALAELAPAATLVMPLGAVQDLFGLGDAIDRLRLSIADGYERQDVQAAVAARLPAALSVQAPVAQLELAGGILRSTEMALQFAGALSLAMAGFIVLNSLRMNFGERRRDMAILRVLGVTSRQLIHLHLVEGLLLGLGGAILGIPLGLAIGSGLAVVMQRLAGADATIAQVPYGALAAALVVGPLVAGVAALVPALESRGVAPAEALGDSEARRAERFPRWSVVSGAVVWAIAVTLLVLVALERLSPQAAIPAGVLMLVGFIAVIPAVLVPFVRVISRLLAPWTEIEGEFAAGQLLQRPTRTGLTVGVLVVSVGTGIGLGNAIINNVDDVRGWYRRITAADVMVAGPSAIDGAVETQGSSPRDKIAEDPDVDYVVEARFLPARADGVPTICIVYGFNPAMELPWAVTAEEAARMRAALKGGATVVGGGLARRLGLKPGDKLRVELQGRVLSLPVAASVRDYSMGGLALYLDQEAAAKLIEPGPAQMYTVAARPGTATGALVERLKEQLDDQGLVVESFATMRGRLDLLIGGIVGALWGLVGIGFVVGGTAVANTLAMSVFEQTREVGLLRVIGATRGQVRKLVFCESLLLGILGTLMGLTAGLTTAWIIHLCHEPLLGYSIPFKLHTWLLATNAVACLMITMLASWLPGERAARLNFLSAVACE